MKSINQIEITKTGNASGKGRNIEFKATRQGYTAPAIEESFIDDSGEICHILTNGNSILKTIYDAKWNAPKTAIKPEHYKGENPDKTQGFIYNKKSY